MSRIILISIIMIQTCANLRFSKFLKVVRVRVSWAWADVKSTNRPPVQNLYCTKFIQRHFVSQQKTFNKCFAKHLLNVYIKIAYNRGTAIDYPLTLNQEMGTVGET